MRQVQFGRACRTSSIVEFKRLFSQDSAVGGATVAGLPKAIGPERAFRADCNAKALEPKLHL
jgi:hypothetical protein